MTRELRYKNKSRTLGIALFPAEYQSRPMRCIKARGSFDLHMHTELPARGVVCAVRGSGHVRERPVERAAGEVKREARVQLERQRRHRAAARTDAREA